MARLLGGPEALATGAGAVPAAGVGEGAGEAEHKSLVVQVKTNWSLAPVERCEPEEFPLPPNRWRVLHLWKGRPATRY